MARHDREDPHSLEEQLAWLDAIKENEEPPVPVTVAADDTVVSPYPNDPWSHVPAEPPASPSPMFRAAGEPPRGGAQPDDGPGERSGDTAEVPRAAAESLGGWQTGDDPWGRPGDDRWGKPEEPWGTPDAYSSGSSGPVTPPPAGSALGERPAASSGKSAFGERPSSAGALGERPSSGGALGERPASTPGEAGRTESGTGAFGLPSGGFGDVKPSAGAFGERGLSAGAFAERRPATETGAFGEPLSGSGAFGEPASPSGAFARPVVEEPSGEPAGEAPAAAGSATPPASPAAQPVSEDTDSFTFGSLAEKPSGGTGSGWPSAGLASSATRAPAGPASPGAGVTGGRSSKGATEAPEPSGEPEPDTSDTRALRGWPDVPRPAEPSVEADPEQERFNAFASSGVDADDIVVPRVEHVVYEPEEKAAPPAPAAGEARPASASQPLAAQPPRAPASPPATSPPATSPPATSPPATSPPATAPPAPAQEAPAAEAAAAQEALEERQPYRPRRRQSTPADGPQPAFGAPSRPQGARGAAKAAVGTRQTADSLDPVSLLRGRKNAPAGGWRRLVFKASAGLIKPGESGEVRRRRELLARARTPVATGHHRVAVLSLKGGVGKTTTTVGLGATLGSVRGDRVIAVDANPDRGTLSDKVELETSATVRDLLNERQQIKRYVDIRAFTSQAPSRLEILASDRDPSVSEAFSAADYQTVAQVLENFYSICITDCGTGLLHSAMSGVLGLADQLVLVSSPSVDGARAASATLDWLEAHHYADLVKDATVVLCSVRPRSKSTIDLDKLEAHFAARCRAVIRVPYDPHLEEGAEIDLDRLQPGTREAYLLLAASVGDGFGGRPL
ncbi:AAA family ATPase [Sphaerisporangium sp. TRM90804]|uniref:nucleotide-binding protein n=1 Tax=Sphaerisporangium sp. TRM90804 TaxID=3031113 RepID=UPI002448F7AF|nr:AAA family ATPase [Sphaerisporangium sp. TRM90804]MDH2425709.1 AAA family ATPase [Sphaerisporangium sp. TRM90804]